jgi:Regulator of Chromosome Condensation (RCC1) repeat protein/regulator of chromosome condensation (RCC1) repeat-containing protein
MTPPRRPWVALISFVPASLLASAFACQEATQVKVDIQTDVPCDQVHGTSFTVGRSDEDLETKPPARVNLGCNDATSSLGRLVLVPTADENDAEFAFKVVTAVEAESVDACVAPDYKGCIVARRVLRYVPQSSLTVTVLMRSSCKNVACSAATTCAADTECRSSSEDPERCARFGLCDPPAAGAGGAGGAAGSGGGPGEGGNAGQSGQSGDAGQGGDAGQSGQGGDAGQGGEGGEGGQGGGPTVTPATFVAGFNHTCAIVGGQLHCWGEQGLSQAAEPTWIVNGRDFGNAPAAQADLPPAIAFAAAGWQNACAGPGDATAGYDLRCFGGNNNFVLGSQPQGQGGQGGQGGPPPSPINGGGTWTQLAAGLDHACGIRGGDVICWGDDAAQQRGIRKPELLGSSTYPDDVLTAVTNTHDWVVLDAGEKFTCGIRSNGNLLCWGQNTSRQLGHNDVSPVVGGPLSPNNTVPAPSGVWLQVSTGTAHACAILSDTSLWCWGKNDKRQSIPTTTAQINTPSQVQIGRAWFDVAAGGAHTCGISSDKKHLYCWGDNALGQLGTEGAPVPNALNEVKDPKPGVDWGRVNAGGFHTCASKGAELYCWGDNSKGQLGIGAAPSASVPTLVPLPPPPAR